MRGIVMDLKYMSAAVESAREGIRLGHGGPFGAAVECGGEVIAVAHNTVLRDRDPTCHAELNAIRLASAHLGTHVLTECTLYTTAEPCPMCMAGIYWARIPRVYVGVRCRCAAHYGFDDAFFYEELQRAESERQISFEYGLLEGDCESVFAEWQERSGQLY